MFGAVFVCRGGRVCVCMCVPTVASEDLHRCLFLSFSLWSTDFAGGGWSVRHGPLHSNGSQAIEVLLLVNRVTNLIRMMRVFLAWKNLMWNSHHHDLVKLH